MPHWILRFGGKVEEDGEVTVKNNKYVRKLVLYFKQGMKHSVGTVKLGQVVLPSWVSLLIPPKPLRNPL